MIRLKDIIKETRIRIYRGESVYNKGGNFYATDPEQARQYTQSGQDKEIATAFIDTNRIFKADPLPFGGDEARIDRAIEHANEHGFSGFWVDEGPNENPSIFVINKLALMKKSYLKENYQLALKLYGERLTDDDVTFLRNLCGNDYTFKTLADLMMHVKSTDHYGWTDKDWKDVVSQLRNYHKNIFPIINFSFDSPEPVVTPQLMKYRAEIIRIIGGWPKIAKRNLRKDIAKPRDGGGFVRLKNKVEYIEAHLGYLDNRDEEQKARILRKIFSSDHPDFESVLDFVEEKENLLQGGIAYTKQGLYALVERYNYDLKIVYDKGDVVVVDVTGQPGMKVIGCNSLWCFTYGSEYGKAGEQFEQYSHNGHVYAIINFKKDQTDPAFIHILIKPFEEQSDYESTYLYNMANDQEYGNSRSVIQWIADGDPSILDVFKWEDY